MKAEIQTIDKQRAEHLLGRMVENRRPKKGLVQQIARDLEMGRWQVNGEPIIIDDKGRLLDGQHRLLAIKITEVPMDTMVVEGVPSESFSTIDSGSKRTAADVLNINGVDHSRSVAAITNTIIEVEQNGLKRGSANRRANKQDIIARALQDPLILSSSLFVREMRKTIAGLIPGSALGAFYYLTQKIDPDDSEYFCTAIATGEKLEVGHPAYAARNKLLVELGSGRRLSKHLTLAIMGKAWNVYRDGGTIEKFYLPGNDKVIDLK